MSVDADSSIDDYVSKRILEKYYKLIKSQNFQKSGIQDVLASTHSVYHQQDPAITNSQTLTDYILPNPVDFYSNLQGQQNAANVISGNTNLTASTNSTDSAEAQTIQQIQKDNQQMLNAVRDRAQQQIAQLIRERDNIMQQSRESILRLQRELDYANQRLQTAKNTQQQTLQDLEQLKHVYDVRQAGIADKLQLTERENYQLNEQLRGLRQEMADYQRLQSQSFSERLRIAEQASRQQLAALAQNLKTTYNELVQTQQDKLLLLKQAAADMCKLNDCIEAYRDKISSLKVYLKQVKSELLIITHENDINSEQNRQNTLEIESLRRRNENLTRELLRVDKMIYGKVRK